MKKGFCVCLMMLLMTHCSHEGDSILVTTPSSTYMFSVEIADESSEWERGLMNRNVLEQDSGMPFVFAEEKMRTFWMKNTTIPLTLLFFNAQKQLVHIVDALPCDHDPCSLYSSQFPTQYVLEINQGILFTRPQEASFREVE